MKLLILLFLFSFNVFSNDCQEGTVIKSYFDIPSEETCEHLLKETAKASCNKDLLKEVERALPYGLERMDIYAGTYCFLKTKSGIFKVTTDWMAEPPVATGIYSIWD